MFQKDYLLRLIEQLTKTLTIIFQLKKKKQHQEALSVIDQSFRQWLGLNSKLINSFSSKDLIEMLTVSQVLGATNFKTTPMVHCRSVPLGIRMATDAYPKTSSPGVRSKPSPYFF